MAKGGRYFFTVAILAQGTHRADALCAGLFELQVQGGSLTVALKPIDSAAPAPAHPLRVSGCAASPILQI